VTLVAVTKTYPASDVVLLSELGVTDMGENRDQEASAKAAAVRAAGAAPRWHFVGRLQRNKARSVVSYADVVESVDSARLVTALSRAAAERPVEVDVLVQVSLDGDPDRGGVVAPGIPEVADAVTAAPGLRLAGLMAVAPMDRPADRAFSELSDIHRRLLVSYPDAVVLSAGMSGDMEEAIKHGATHVRIGTSLLGMRNLLR
jgi:PLP dependent protein